MQNICFNWNMNNFKLSFLWQGQIKSLTLDKFFTTVFKILQCHEVFFGNLTFAIIAGMFWGSHLNPLNPFSSQYQYIFKQTGNENKQNHHPSDTL